MSLRSLPAMRRIPWILAALALLTAGVVKAQTPVVLITDGGTQQYCNVSFQDGGGINGDYGPNENEVITFCPGVPGDSLQASFLNFDLGPGDQLVVYDGPSTASTILATGTDTQSLAGSEYTATNATGCITFQFTSDGSGNGAGWESLIQCNHPCPPPTANATPLTLADQRICPGDSIPLIGTGSTAAPGRTITSYQWDMGSGPFATFASGYHVFNSPGQYTAYLSVVDDIGCGNLNDSHVTTQVGTHPDFTTLTSAPNPICVGESATITGAAQGHLWSSVPQPLVNGEVALPDAQGQPATYTANVNVMGFPDGTTISNPTDIVDVCMVMEHSYIGDLIVSLNCPDGSSVLLFDGNGSTSLNTYLGSPIDNGGDNGIPGTGWLYCFSTSAALGTIVQENNNGYWQQSGSPPGNSMIPGTYTSQQPFSNWTGCDLNGAWTLSITDDQGSDDGFIFSWWMDIDPSLYPDVIEFTPTVGADCDSSYWSGPAITGTQPGCDQITVMPSMPGSNVYTYTVTDNYGCTYDTTLTLTVTPAAIPTATSTLPPHCGDPVQLGVNLALPIPSGALVYQWSPANGLSNPGIPFPTADPPANTWYSIHVFPSGHPLCGSTDSVLVHPLSILEDDSVVVDATCHADGTGSIQVITTGNGGPWDYTWTDAGGTVVQTTLTSNGDTFHGSGGTYEVHVSEGANGNGCVDSLQATIYEPAAVQMDFISSDTLICRTGAAHLHASAQGGSGQLTIHWSNGVSGDPNVVAPLTLSHYEAWATDPNGCLSDTLDVDVSVNPPLAMVFAVDTLTTCPNVDLPVAPDSYGGGDGEYHFLWSAGSTSPDTVLNTGTSQQLCLTLTDGCETPAVTRCVQVEVTPIPPLVLTVDSTLGCDPFAVRFSVKDTTGGATVIWDFGDGVVAPGPPTLVGHTYTDPGHFDVHVIVHWPNGCADDTTAVDLVRVEPVPQAEFTWAPDPASVLDPQVQFYQQAGPYAVSYEWDFAGLDTSHAADPLFRFPGDLGDTYPVRLVVANYLGCTDTVVRMIEVADEFLVFIPDAFTPNGDGVNDVFGVIGNDISPKDFELMVFDRWGELVYDSTDRTKGWDGRLNGTPAKQEVYNWRLLARSAYTGQRHELMGHVTLLR